MDYFFKLLFSKGSTASISAILLFTSPIIKSNGKDVIVSGNLKGIITHKVHRIIKTGTPVNIHFHVTLKSFYNTREKIYTNKFIHIISYNALKKNYIIKKGAFNKTIQIKKTAEVHLGKYKTTFYNIYPKKGEIFQVYSEAELSYKSSLKIPIKGSALWDYYIPSIKTKGIVLK